MIRINKGAVRQHDSDTTAAFKGGGYSRFDRIDRYLPGWAVYFFLWNDRINTTNVAKEIISVNAWYTSTGITSLQGD